MTIATQCKYFGHVITIEKALAIRAGTLPRYRGMIHFECLTCGCQVRPYAAGDKCRAHFSHVIRNNDCRYKDPQRHD